MVTIFADRFLALLEDTAPSWLRFSSQVVEGKGHYQYAGLNTGLSALFGDHEFPTERFLTEGPEAEGKHIEQLKGRSGWPVDPNTIKGERAIVDAACDLGRQRRFSDAIRMLDYGIEQYPKSAALKYYRAQIYEHSGNVAQAKSEYQSVFDLEPSSGLAGMTRIFLDNMAAQTDREAKAHEQPVQ